LAGFWASFIAPALGADIALYPGQWLLTVGLLTMALHVLFLMLAAGVRALHARRPQGVESSWASLSLIVGAPASGVAVAVLERSYGLPPLGAVVVAICMGAATGAVFVWAARRRRANP